MINSETKIAQADSGAMRRILRYVRKASCRCACPLSAFCLSQLSRLSVQASAILLVSAALPARAAVGSGRHAAGFAGRVVDAATLKPIPYAGIYVHELSLGSAADANGAFSLPTGGGTYRLTVSYLGYQPIDTVAAASTVADLLIALQPRSLALSEVVVWATESVKNPSTSIIGKAALVHVQPSSFADVMQLLPGHLIKDVKMEEANFITMRQAGSDVNTSLGTAFLVDDASLNRDAGLQNVHNAGDAILSRATTSRGVDMRRISTDRIEKVEVVRGIPSVRYGNLTSGLVKIETKSGATPWEARAKIDLTNQLFSVGKGFALPRNGGTLNVDADYLDYHPDPRNVLTSYRRATFSSRYRNRFAVADGSAFLLKANLSYTGSFDDEKRDPEQMSKEESYNAAYNDVTLSSSGELQLGQSLLSVLKYTATATYASDRLNLTRVVVAGSAPLPSATSEGAHYAAFLPSVYTAKLQVDDRPLSLYADAQAQANPQLGNLRQRLLLGAEWRRDANVGQGELYDLTRPPYPGSTSTRPRPYNAVPALQQLALYAEDDATLDLGAWRATLRAGVRATTLPGQPTTYQMAGQWYAEPRVTAGIYFPKFSIFDRRGLLSLNAGYGKHYKLPTQAQLYPDNVYFDYIQLNYYSQQEALTALNVQTRIEDPAPYGIHPALNVKHEAGLNVELEGASAGITVFDERMDNGFASVAHLVQHTYRRYDETAVPPESLTAAPAVEMFPYVETSILSSYSSTGNCSQVHKRGVEYQLTLGRIRAIYSSIRLSGAWFHTAYRTAGLRYKKPTIIINQEPYPYTGLYTWSNDNRIRRQLNTNLYLETHIPTLRMIFTTSVQTVWFTKTEIYRNNGLPTWYMDKNGQLYEFTESDAQNPLMLHLTETYNARFFDTDKVPPEASLNLKMTKEIGSTLRISFYVNRLLNYAPDYISRYGITTVRTAYSSFGAEVNVKIG